ncbi:L-threonylcarbamoyladenylate synthase [Rhodoferax ferrireducens]|uniref:L-threonylcarbamoyladenylate synthase n=1 Tax=Rhodoferax ferrireducens TaxID=192843 RepID=UPI00298DF889|nr:L-threonylcarbamoyladenylate synthase [Rhodoferax ferrireducens]WPC69061.1 L-threonylcarbamoyladenylate synthase [Rhodoferax ferrireducens]
MILDGFAASSVALGAQRIRAGGLLGLPTETVYGLAADAENDAAVAQIFTAKGRPADHPLIVHVRDAVCVGHFAAQVPDFADRLMQAFWPGPLTLILPRRPGVASAAAGGQDTIGLRCPSHPVAQALLQALLQNGGQIPTHSESAKPQAKELASQPHGVWGIAAPSANQFGRVSPTTAAHVQSEFGPDLLILDGGACTVGIESTIIDCTRGQPVLLRPGAITREQVQAACGLKVLLKDELATDAAPAPKASGTLESHYAPKATVRLMDAAALRAALARWVADEAAMGPAAGVAVATRARAQAPALPTIAVYARSVHPNQSSRLLSQHMPADATAAARELFAVLRRLDAQGVQQIWIETPPAGAEWDGVRDRLQRAASQVGNPSWRDRRQP